MPETDGQTDGERPRPLSLVPPLPDKKQVTKLKNSLVQLGLSKEAASALAAAVVNPDTVQQLLSNPTKHRVPGAELLVVRALVYSPRVLPDPTNPRVVNDFAFPIAIEPGTAPKAPFAPIESPEVRGKEFVLQVKTIDQLSWQLQTAMDSTVRRNKPKPPIESQGIMDPPLAVPCRIEVDGKRPEGALLIREGSTRISHAHRILSVKSSQLLAQYRDDRQLGALILELNKIANSLATDISDADAARIRVAVVPLDIVIGHEPDEPGGMTLQDAVDAKVGQEHLNHKAVWDDSAKDVHLGDLCIAALEASDVLSPERAAWLAGRMTSKDAKQLDFETFPEDRWTELVWHFTTKNRQIARVLRQSIASQLENSGAKGGVRSRTDKLPLAVNVALRSRRPHISERAAEREAQILIEGVPSIVLGKIDWPLDVSSVRDLLAGAVAEAEARDPGPNAAALAVRALWYLVANGQILGRRHDLGAGGDRRSSGDLVDAMLRSPRGLAQLARAIEDGRLGRKAAKVKETIDDIAISGVGKPVELEPKDVRTEFAPPSGSVTPESDDPMQVFLDALARFHDSVNATVRADEGLREVEDDSGRPIYEKTGIPMDHGDELKKLLRTVIANIEDYQLYGRRFDGGAGV